MTSEAKPKAMESAVPATNGAAGTSHAKPVIRVIMADSQAIYRVGMRKVFAVEDDIQILAQVDSLATLQAALAQHPTDVLVLEGNLLAGKGSAIGEILHQWPTLKIIVQATANDEAHIVELYRRGVRGVIPRSISPDLLVK